MKHLLLSLLLTISGVFLLNSCETKDPEPTPTACLISSITYSGEYDETFEYDAKGRLIKYSSSLSDNSYAQYDYNPDGKVSEIKQYDEGELEYITTVNYTTTGQWTSYVQRETGNTSSWEVKATYDGEGNRIKVETYEDGILESWQEFKFKNGDVVEATWNEDGKSRKFVYEYDTSKENVFRHVGELVTMADGGGEPYSAHLATKSTEIDGSIQSTYQHHYIFNNQGLPVETWATDEQGNKGEESKIAYTCQ